MLLDEQNLEVRHLEKVEGIIQENLRTLFSRRDELKEEVRSVRRDMWELGRHQVRDFDDVVTLSMEGSVVKNAEIQYEQNERQIERHERQRACPYFARLDYDDGGTGRSIYIGIYSLRGEGARRMEVIDWRAPAASMFYSFDLGPGWFEAAGGKRQVNITLKRQFKIEDGELLLMYDADSAMYDEILGQVLSENTSHNLKVIIGSIQKEQNAAIRGDTRRSCLIYGLAGSGKTSVGLHRLAYILYHNRDKIRHEDILVISNNSIFGSYISGILPDLGEEPVDSTVFHHILSDAVGDRYDVQEYYGYLKAVDADKDRARLLTVKCSLEFLSWCEEYFAAFNYKLPTVKYRELTVFSSENVEGRWDAQRFSSFKAGYELLRQMAKDQAEEFFMFNKQRILLDIEQENQELSEREQTSVYNCLKREYTANLLDEIGRLNRLDPEKQAVDILKNYLERIGEDGYPAAELFREFQEGRLSYENALYYLFIRILMGETDQRTSVKHIVIDEAQDYNLLQLRIIRKLYPKSIFTILADVFQAVGAASISDYDVFDRAFQQTPLNVEPKDSTLMKLRLNKCYRSSGEINALAFKLISGQADTWEYSYFERHKKRPRYVAEDSYADMLPRLDEILAGLDSYKTIGIITGKEEEAQKVKEYLDRREIKAKLIVSLEDELSGRLVVLPLLLAKGLEFDAVILVDLIHSGKDAPNPRRRLYLGCTRALHELYILESGQLPEGFSDCKEYMDF